MDLKSHCSLPAYMKRAATHLFNPIGHGLFLNRQSWEGGMRAPHHNFVVIVPMIMKFGTGVKPDVFYTIVKKIVTSLLYVIVMS